MFDYSKSEYKKVCNLRGRLEKYYKIIKGK